jgi:hypothetical protein
MVRRPFDEKALPRSGGKKSLDSQFKIVAEAFLELFELLEEYHLSGTPSNTTNVL